MIRLRSFSAARVVSGQEIAYDLAAASTNWVLLGFAIGLEVDELVGIDRIANAQREHLELLSFGKALAVRLIAKIFAARSLSRYF
jgi:hypothetical protein